METRKENCREGKAIEKRTKKRQNLKLETQNGITLVALIVTIIVLIILATVSINAVIGENGIIKKAKEVKQLYNNSIISEEESMNTLVEEYENMMAEPPDPTADWDLSKVTAVTSEDNIVVPVPIGYTASTVTGEKSVATGFVIKKGTDGSLTSGINEFVWVPVSEEAFANMFKTAEPAVALSGSTSVTSNYYSNLREINEGHYGVATVKNGAYSATNKIREPDLVTTYDEDTTNAYYEQAGYESAVKMAEGFVEDYTNMRASIEKYKGFYIGRYELTGTVDNPTVQSGNVLISSPSKAGNWYGLYKACRNVETGNSKVTSTMIWGCQWDETMNWLKNTKFKDNPDAVDVDSTSWGNYKDSTGNAQVMKEDGTTQAWGSQQITGYSKYWSANNIYDLVGNCWEWTQEAYGTQYRSNRGRKRYQFGH